MYNVLSMESMAQQLNDIVYSDYLYRLTLIARSVFEWENLPNNIDEKWIEKYLFSDGKCVFFEDVNNGFMIAKVSSDGTYNYYDEPTLIRPYGNRYQGTILENDVDCVVIRNNDDMIPTFPTIHHYAYKLANISRTIDVNIEAQKTPVIIKCTNKQMNTLKYLMKQRADNEPLIWGDKNLDTTGVEAMTLNVPMVFKDLELQKHMIWNECMTFLGVNNANMDKRERLVDDEVQANNEQVEASFNIMLKARQQACKRINEIFGTNIQVKRRITNKPVLKLSEGSEGIDDIDSEGSDNNE